RVRYLTKTDAGYEAMDRAGVHVSPRTLMAWLAEERKPRSKAMLARVDAAYWDLRRRNVAGTSRPGCTTAGAEPGSRSTPSTRARSTANIGGGRS
ncbi:hypothetical protein I6J41_35060, partial (plasmid) [Streptomyces californicus]